MCIRDSSRTHTHTHTHTRTHARTHAHTHNATRQFRRFSVVQNTALKYSNCSRSLRALNGAPGEDIKTVWLNCNQAAWVNPWISLLNRWLLMQPCRGSFLGQYPPATRTSKSFQTLQFQHSLSPVSLPPAPLSPDVILCG